MPNKQIVTIRNLTQGNVLCPSAAVADTPSARMTGLLKHDSLPKDEGLVITKCQSIHMFFMKFPIDAVFVNKRDVVVGLVRNIQPFWLSPIFFTASYVIELSAGSIARLRISKKDQLKLEPISS